MPNFVSSGMSTSQDNLLNQEVNEAQGEDLLDQSVHSVEDSSDDVIVEYERIIRTPESPKYGCEEHDLYRDDRVTDSQLLRYVEVPTQGQVPKGSANSPEVKTLPPSEAIEGIESQQSAPQRDGQDIIGQGDLVDLSPEQELPPGQGDSIILESVPYQLDPSEQDIQDYIKEMREKSTLQDTSDAISSFSSNFQEDKGQLRVVGERML